jgi:Zn-dependent peptidase ImmA (M78 family)
MTNTSQEFKFSSANELLSFLSEQSLLKVEAPIDLEKITKVLGISVEDDMTLHQKGVVGEICFSGNEPVVRINPFENTYRPRRRFTLAHELGHFCLHREGAHKGFVDSKETMSRSESYWDFYESEANNFAAQLLMPKSLIIKEGREIIRAHEEKGSKLSKKTFIELIAKRFEVSNKSMEYRLKNIGILN